MPLINPKLSTCYIANVGMGKTMIMTYLHAIPALEAGVKVISDYKINWKGSNLSYFTPEEFDEVCMTWRNCIVMIDEIGIILDSREFKDEGSNTRKFFSYHRKHHVEIVSSTQHISQVAKTSKNLVTDWYITSEISKDSWLMETMLNLIKFKGVVIKTERVELHEISNEKEVINPDAPLVFGRPEKGKTYWLSEKKLRRYDLNDKKEELDYLGCTICRTRFTELDKEDTKDFTICPLCMEKSIGRIISIMYDTDYELPNPEKTITFQALIDSPKGYRKIPFKGYLNQEQTAYRNKLAAKYQAKMETPTENLF